MGIKKSSLSIKSEIFVLSFIFLTLVSVLFSGIFLGIFYQTNLNSAKNSLKQCNSQVVTYAEGMFHENASMLKLLAGLSSVVNAGDGDVAYVLELFDAIQKSNANITNIFSAYENGILLINNYEVPEGFDSTARPWYQAALEEEVYGMVYKDVNTHMWMFNQSRRLVDGNGNIVGVISIDCSNETIAKQLSTKYQYDSQRSYIVDLEGTVLLHLDESEINTSLMECLDQQSCVDFKEEHSGYIEYSSSNQKSMAYYERIPETEFCVVTAITASEVMKPIFRSLGYTAVLVICISIGLGFILSRILLRRFAVPVMALQGRIENIAAGNIDRKQELGFSNAEIDSISQSIQMIAKDIASREEQRREAEYLGFHDSMTGLYNRCFFEEEFSRIKDRGQLCCLVCCDVNGLKLVNDVFGHHIGDKLIVTVANSLISCCKQNHVVARIGGDEFVVLMPHTSALEAQRIIQRIKSGLQKESICGAVVSVSMGYSVQSQGEFLDDMMVRADKMMYAQKLTESVRMKQRTMSNILKAAEKEGLVKPLSDKEDMILSRFAAFLCPESENQIKQSYYLRNIGLCSLFHHDGYELDEVSTHHTETSYRLLSSIDDYRNVALCLLHYTEHWDGSGQPVGLSGRNIPIISRILAITDGYFEADGAMSLLDEHPEWYDPKLLELLLDVVK